MLDDCQLRDCADRAFLQSGPIIEQSHPIPHGEARVIRADTHGDRCPPSCCKTQCFR
jgi:hypothetical protein